MLIRLTAEVCGGHRPLVDQPRSPRRRRHFRRATARGRIVHTFSSGFAKVPLYNNYVVQARKDRGKSVSSPRINEHRKLCYCTTVIVILIR